jgi:hypothetical protein
MAHHRLFVTLLMSLMAVPIAVRVRAEFCFFYSVFPLPSQIMNVWFNVCRKASKRRSQSDLLARLSYLWIGAIEKLIARLSSFDLALDA